MSHTGSPQLTTPLSTHFPCSLHTYGPPLSPWQPPAWFGFPLPPQIILVSSTSNIELFNAEHLAWLCTCSIPCCNVSDLFPPPTVRPHPKLKFKRRLSPRIYNKEEGNTTPCHFELFFVRNADNGFYFGRTRPTLFTYGSSSPDQLDEGSLHKKTKQKNKQTNKKHIGWSKGNFGKKKSLLNQSQHTCDFTINNQSFPEGEIGRQHVQGASGYRLSTYVISPHPLRPIHTKTRPQHWELRPLLFTNSEWVL